MTMTKQEAELIHFIRGLYFEDLWDATTGILTEMNRAGKMSYEKRVAGDLLSAEGFSKRADALEKLSGLLGDANTDYRNHSNAGMEPDENPEKKLDVTQMADSDVGEIIHLFEVMKKHNVLCSVEIRIEGNSDPLFGLVDYPILSCEYFERKSGPDSIVIVLGNEESSNELNFELNLGCFKDISEEQIFICIASDHYTAWFNSGSIPLEGIEEASNYEEIDTEFEDKEIHLIAGQDNFREELDFAVDLIDQGRVIKKTDVKGDGHQVLTIGFFK